MVQLLHSSSANASPSFEGKGGDDIALELSNGLAKVVNSQTLDLESFLIVPGKHCWALFIDAVVFFSFISVLEQ